MPISEKLKNQVAVPDSFHSNMGNIWDMVDTLRSHTEGMRKAGQKYLPKFSAEETDDYQTRKKRSFLLATYNDTVSRLVEKPFSQPVAVIDLPSAMEYMKYSVDQMETNIHAFLKDLLDDGINYGMWMTVVDFTSVEESTRKLTKAEEKKLNLRAIVKRIKRPDFLGYQSEIRGGQITLTKIRWRQMVMENSGKYGQQEVEYVKVLSETDWELHKKDENGDFQMVESGTHSFGSIPVSVGYTRRTGYLEAEPPLINLAEKNIEFWQSSSQQNWILDFSRFAILFGKGFDDAKDGSITVGPKNMVIAPSREADLKFVEHTGAAIESGERDLARLKEEMEMMGMQPILAKTGKQTATSQAIHDENDNCELKSWVRSLRISAIEIFELAAHWHGIELPETFNIEIYNDFETATLGAEDYNLVLMVRDRKGITTKTMVAEAQRRGILSNDYDAEEEVALAEEEGMEALKSFIDLNGKENKKDSQTSNN